MSFMSHFKLFPVNDGLTLALPAPQSVHATAIMVVFFAYLLIIKDKHHHQTLVSSSLYHPGHCQKISST